MPPSPSLNRSMTPLEWSLLLLLALVWAGSFFFQALAVRELPVLTVVVARVGLGALILLAVLRLAGRRLPRGRRVWAAFFGMGLLNNAIPFSLVVWGQQQIASGLASILNAATPLFTVLFAQLFTSDEKMTGGRLLGVAVGFAGVAVMIGLEAFSLAGDGVAAQLACLAAAISYALAGLFGRRFHRLGVTPLATATGQLVASSLLLLPALLLLDRPWSLPLPSLTAILALLGVASLSTALAYVLYFRILATAGATNLLLVTFLIPLGAVLLGLLFLSEVLLPRHVAGMVLIGLGLAAIDGRAWRWLRGVSRSASGCREPGSGA